MAPNKSLHVANVKVGHTLMKAAAAAFKGGYGSGAVVV
jgi:hypothetical protein